MTTNDTQSSSRPQTSARDYHVLRDRVEAWIAHRVSGATVSDLVVPQSNGMSSETVLFDMSVPGQTEPRPLVARIAPELGARPIFPTYDLERQFKTMEMVVRHTDVPVPEVLWLETGTDAIGAPFFVMERAEGLVPPDVMPYTSGANWFFDASPEDQQRLEINAVGVLAKLHVLSTDGPASFLSETESDESHLRRHVRGQQSYYDWVVEDGIRSPLIERGFAWLEDHWPTNESGNVLSWGDARIGNMMFRDFTPVAVLDWEMAAVGPRELDLGWMIYMHRFFQDIVEDHGLPGMPDVLRRDNVADLYAQMTGHRPADLDFYIVYAALRHAIVMFRYTRRAIHFGEAQMPEDPDQGILHHHHLRALLDGVYWPAIEST
jgi:aminoglycoside phosphotransferase (APT) family kinase protein